MIKKTHRTAGTGTLIALALAISSEEGLARPGRLNCPFHWRKGTHRRAHLLLTSLLHATGEQLGVGDSRAPVEWPWDSTHCVGAK